MWLLLTILFGFSITFGPLCLWQCAKKKKDKNNKKTTSGDTDQKDKESESTGTDKSSEDKKSKDKSKDKDKAKSEKKKKNKKKAVAKSCIKVTEDADLKSRSNYDVKTGATVIPNSAKRPTGSANKNGISGDGTRPPPVASPMNVIPGNACPPPPPEQYEPPPPPPEKVFITQNQNDDPGSNMRTIKSHFG